MAEYKLNLFADFFQFYLQDERQEDLSLNWTEEEMNNWVALARGTIGIRTARNVTVPVTLEVRELPPGNALDQWDRIYECSIEVPSGRLVVAGCTDYLPDAARIELTPGSYCARIYHGGLESLRENEVEGDDHYRIVLWPTPVVAPSPLD